MAKTKKYEEILKELADVKEQNQQILLLLQLLLSSDKNLKMRCGKIEKKYDRERELAVLHKDKADIFKAPKQTFDEYFKDTIKEIVERYSIPSHIIESINKEIQK